MNTFTILGMAFGLLLTGCGSQPPAPAATPEILGRVQLQAQHDARLAACQSELTMLAPYATDAQHTRTCHEKWHYMGRYADLCYQQYVGEARRAKGPSVQLVPEDTIRLVFCSPRAKNDIMTAQFYEKLNAEWSVWVERN